MEEPDVFETLLLRPARPRQPAAEHVPDALQPAIQTLAREFASAPALRGIPLRRAIEAVIAEIDRRMGSQLNHVLHHPDFQALEASWRGLHFLVRAVQSDSMLKIRLFDISQRELGRTLRKFRGTAWDHSPIFKKIYEEEYGQLGGEPFGVLIGDYSFDHHPHNIQMLADMAAVAAAAHVPFIGAASPALTQMDSWSELANPRDLGRIFQTPDYAAWRALRETEDARYVGLCMPRMLSRLPYGAATDPVDDFAFEEECDGPDNISYAWANPAFAMGANIARAFSLYGWCTQIHGIETGGLVDDLPILRFATADGETDTRSCTEIALSERREAELCRLGLIPLVYRKNAAVAAFISAHSLQKPAEYDDPEATANAALASRLPYLFACCRFAHYLKCLVRDKVGGTLSRAQLEDWLSNWLLRYVDGSPSTSNDDWKAAHPLEEANVTLEERPDMPGQYDAKFFLKPHYQLEGLTIALRLVSRLPSQ